MASLTEACAKPGEELLTQRVVQLAEDEVVGRRHTDLLAGLTEVSHVAVRQLLGVEVV